MIAAAQVRANRTRQAVDRARARGHVPRPMSPQAPPAAAERAYTARLRMIVGGALTRAYAPLLRALPDLVAQARQERAKISAPACGAGEDAIRRFGTSQQAIKALLPAEPNERMRYNCQPAP